MTIISHGITGGLLYGIIAKLLGIYTVIPIVVGVLFGAGPDLITWIAYKFFKKTRWELQSWAHSLKNKWGWSGVWLLHTWLDTFVHSPGEGINLQKYVIGEILLTLANVLLLLLFLGI